MAVSFRRFGDGPSIFGVSSVSVNPSAATLSETHRGCIFSFMADPQQELPTLRTERLTLVALTPEAYTAWAAGDAQALSAATGVAFEDATAPPLLDEDLPKIRDLVN